MFYNLNKLEMKFKEITPNWKYSAEKVANVFNCEAFHLEHINNTDDAKQLMKYEIRNLGLIVHGSGQISDLTEGTKRKKTTLTEEELKCATQLWNECVKNFGISYMLVLEMKLIDSTFYQCTIFDMDLFGSGHITTIDDVKRFTKVLIDIMGLNITVDTNFETYIDEYTDEPYFSKKDGKTGNRLMKECFKVCKANNVDFNDIIESWKKKYIIKKS